MFVGMEDRIFDYINIGLNFLHLLNPLVVYHCVLFLSSLPSVPSCRRGNWITLKLKKLMKSSSREQEPEQAATPSPSDVAQTHPFCPDTGSCISSDGSGGSSSTSAGDAISPQRTDCEYDL